MSAASDLADALGGAKKSGNGWVARCPAHEDHDPSLSISDGVDGRVLVHCFAGCSQDAVVDALRAKGLWANGGDAAGTQQKDEPVGLTLSVLANAKRLPEQFLRHLGLTDAKRNQVPCVKIPYLDATGTAIAQRYRLSLKRSGQRFAWRTGDHAMLYGLDRMKDIRKAGWVLLVEGESDCWTMWFHNLPALGIPGKSTWRDEWSAHLKGLDVFVWQEPDAEELPQKIAVSIPTLQIIYAPTGTKDISEAHIRGEDVVNLVGRLKAHAVAAETIRHEKANAAAADWEKQAAPVLASTDPMVLVEQAIKQLGYGGDIKLAEITYLAATSRLLAQRPGSMPVHLILVGPSSAGKSWTLSVILRLLPPEAHHTIDAGSPRVLIYDDFNLKHCVLVFGEADSLPAGEDNPAASAVRNLLQENRLCYDTVIRDEVTGKFTTQHITRDGPTTLITTAVRRLGDQLMTRLFALEVAGDPAQVRAALATQAKLELDGAAPPDAALISFQGYLQAHAPWDVVVPFAEELAAAIGKSASAPRIQRDYLRLLSLIKAVAVVRHRHRQVDSQGRLVAELSDYDFVRNLVGQMYNETVTGVTAGVRAAVAAVEQLVAKSNGKVTVTAVGATMGVSKMAASRRVNAALKAGYLVNDELPHKNRFDLKIGEPLPDNIGLPTAEELVVGNRNDVTPPTDESGSASDLGEKAEEQTYTPDYDPLEMEL